MPPAPQPTSKSSATKAAIAALAALVLFQLWRADIVPGIWDIQHWNEDLERTARVERAAHRAARLASFASQPQPSNAVLFIGSSTIERMPLAQLFPTTPALNRGIGDEPAAGLLARITGPDAAANHVDWSSLAAVVIYPASVDFRRLGISPQENTRRAFAIVDAIATQAPQAQLLVLGLLSERDIAADRRARLDQTNALFEKECALRKIEFLNLDSEPLTQPLESAALGPLTFELSSDRLHLNELGYQVLGRLIRKSGGPVSSLIN